MANGLVNWNGFDLVDLTYTYEEGMPVWPTHPHYFANPCEQYETGWYFNQIILGEHNGTHIDSPGHHVKEGPAHYFVDKLDINRFFGTARILDVYTDYGEDYELKVEQVKETGAFLISLLPFLFVSHVVGIVEHWDAIRAQIFPICLLIVATTVLVFGVSGRLAQLLRKGGKSHE